VPERLDYFARSLDEAPRHQWQKLEDHLKAVALKAAASADHFGSREWGYWAGLWHDLGKYLPQFQSKLLGKRIAVEHSGAGAALAQRHDKDMGTLLAFVIAGHHTGLANLITSGHNQPTPLAERLKANESILGEILTRAPVDITSYELPKLPQFLQVGQLAQKQDVARWRRHHEFWIRFLFSAVVDADRLDAQEFTEPDVARSRGRFSPVADLRKSLDEYIDRKMRGLSQTARESPVNLVRAQVLQACRENALCQPGIFALTVPTGGGKTLSAMSFALRHSQVNNLRRVIVVIPYTSIIEQNAEEYRKALGVENVVEHHSNLDPVEATARAGEEITLRHHLASENWDAPIIVTTSVQFLETLFSNRPSRCRKLHNVAKSVVILDEVQTLPPGFLLSIVESLNELVDHYGCTVVLSTATPPALTAREGFEVGLRSVTEIVPNPAAMAKQLQRVEFRWPSVDEEVESWPSLAAKLRYHHQVLVVVHRRADARELAEEVQKCHGSDGLYHLSALMCPAHRSEVLATIREKLAAGAPCRVISTQLVEAGVDVDFPVVYRALGGFDSIVQAAGRCNREGKLAVGMVKIFRASSPPPRGTPRRAIEVTEALLRDAGGTLDPDDPVLFDRYFRMLYIGENQDVKGIQALRQEFNFAAVGHEFQIIEDGFAQPVIVPYGGAEERLQVLRRKGPSTQRLRSLQPFIVNIYPNAFEKLQSAGALDEVQEGICTLTPVFRTQYDSTFGFLVGDEPTGDPDMLVV